MALIAEAVLILEILCARSLRNAAAISPEHSVHAGLPTQRTLLKRMASQRLGSAAALGSSQRARKGRRCSVGSVDDDCGLGRRRDKEMLIVAECAKNFDMEGINIRAVQVKSGTDNEAKNACAAKCGVVAEGETLSMRRNSRMIRYTPRMRIL
jgi:hypothetical protein